LEKEGSHEQLSSHLRVVFVLLATALMIVFNHFNHSVDEPLEDIQSLSHKGSLGLKLVTTMQDTIVVHMLSLKE